MATTIRQTELVPDTVPTTPTTLTDPAFVWARIESYIAYRYSARTVTWIVEGPGGWFPPLAPWTVDPSSVSRWSHRAKDWELFTSDPTPLSGFYFPNTGPFRITATVGVNDATVPEAVAQAVLRLGNYLAADPGKPGITSETFSIGSELTASIRRDANWMAMALQNSGAADLLRPYRKVV